MAELLLSAFAVLLMEQLSKKIVRRLHVEGRLSSNGSLVRIRFLTNAKGIPGFGSNHTVLLLLWVLAAFSMIALVSYGQLFQSLGAQVGLGSALGGATGNLVDRLRWKAVVDFIDFGFWPVFNLADAAIVLGLTAAFLLDR